LNGLGEKDFELDKNMAQGSKGRLVILLSFDRPRKWISFVGFNLPKPAEIRSKSPLPLEKRERDKRSKRIFFAPKTNEISRHH
jgi:hypothetical protein